MKLLLTVVALLISTTSAEFKISEAKKLAGYKDIFKDKITCMGHKEY